MIIERISDFYLQGLVFFGEDISKIPCIRNALMHAIGAGCLSGIIINLATSRNTLGMSIGVFNVVLFGSW